MVSVMLLVLTSFVNGSKGLAYLSGHVQENWSSSSLVASNRHYKKIT